ncbi:hypothetical protein HYH02_001800 [Chlamydomonas schloesseri]|uniref:Serine aminopeptidase S33 domain-containing protein n=1 Tax=Chlamydomonas schloesseri TaxID=2026947 RepID=A0A835WTA7_9CHLO|nr:hypothetical protein HYH02_001800 [Chlamydomonas schloesseri]|eukprot:KAG2453582.1 hypothetical protein HYH02_001800 [Chlamydomonas schloesseri]
MAPQCAVGARSGLRTAAGSGPALATRTTGLRSSHATQQQRGAPSAARGLSAVRGSRGLRPSASPSDAGPGPAGAISAGVVEVVEAQQPMELGSDTAAAEAAVLTSDPAGPAEVVDAGDAVPAAAHVGQDAAASDPVEVAAEVLTATATAVEAVAEAAVGAAVGAAETAAAVAFAAVTQDPSQAAKEQPAVTSSFAAPAAAQEADGAAAGADVSAAGAPSSGSAAASLSMSSLSSVEADVDVVEAAAAAAAAARRAQEERQAEEAAAAAAVAAAAAAAATAAAAAEPSAAATPAPPQAPQPAAPTPAPAATGAPAAASGAGAAGRVRRRAPPVDLPIAEMMARGRSTAARPFPPQVDFQRISEAVLGEPTIGPTFRDLFELSQRRSEALTAEAEAEAGAQEQLAPGAAAAGPGPLLYAPRFPRPAGSPDPSTLPLLVYLPGIDGTGLAAYRQFPGLASKFDLRGVFMPPEDRTPFAGLVESVARQIEDEATGLDPGRPVYLLGESFGGIMALALAQRLSCVDRLILVNPATSFDRSPWPALGPLLPALPADAYKLLPVALSPILTNPISMARRAANPGDPLPQQAADLLYGLLDLIPELSSLRVVLPPQTLAWRLQLLAEGAAAVNPTLGKVKPRTLLLVGSNDMVIPSASEAPRLERSLPRCTSRVVEGGSHALLQESQVDLVRLIQDEDFYTSRRRLTRPNVPAGFNPDTATRPAPGGANFGTPGPLELPTAGELRRAADGAGLGGLRRLVSPVYLSTDPGSGRVVLGLDRLPAPRSGPMLFVGNHQLFAPDMPLMIQHFLEERGQLLRGLAHPMALGMGPGNGGPIPGRDSNSRFGRFLETFGAVPVSGRHLYQLLAAGEAALLYPGGVREALKLRNEQYALIWPRRAEFVRMAMKFGATIIPFAAVGAEDAAEVVLDRTDLMAAPLLGDFLRQQQDSIVRARRGVSEAAEVEESFISPLVALKPPARFYYLFGAPITTSAQQAEDREQVEATYGRVKSEVEGCLGYLLRKRESDPYKDLPARLLYEASWGGRRQAPTFNP